MALTCAQPPAQVSYTHPRRWHHRFLTRPNSSALRQRVMTSGCFGWDDLHDAKYASLDVPGDSPCGLVQTMFSSHTATPQAGVTIEHSPR
jgi:hypothetical protein